MRTWIRKAAISAAVAIAGATAGIVRADDTTQSADVAAQLKALQTRVAELEAKENENWMTQERTSQIRSIVEEVLADAKKHGQFADGPEVGYKDGFFIQTQDGKFKLVISGFMQIRYEYAQSNATNGRTFPPRPVGSPATNVTPSDPGNSSGFDIRRARIAFAGNIFTPDLTFKMEGDFYGSTVGSFTVTDAWVAYRFTDLIRVKVGSFKVPYTKAELTPDPVVMTPERSEVSFPFDAQRSLGVSLYGDIIKDTLSYEVNINDGTNDNTLRRNDTVGVTANLDNRLGFYARMQWAGSGKISEFVEESDLRDPKGNRDFIWMLGVAGGYESQNSSNNAFPSPQTSGTGTGISNGDGPGFTNYTLNGDLFRGTIDWSAKYQGAAFLTAAYIQQFNANTGNANLGTTGNNNPSTGPYGATDSSFFQTGAYGQVGYFVVPQKLELVGRAGILLTEGYPNYGEFYTLGANYYVFGQNFKIQSDITYSPEAAYTDNASSLLQNTHDVIFRVQLQLKF